ncbi:unnamed protein product [Durusdinium trenchii]|uniref:CDAN1-interacting nuclease 1 n=1 Tax=Durusdinium trenchii TaxID=1381693 RepID=A0ABP0KF67_9DINO
MWCPGVEQEHLGDSPWCLWSGQKGLALSACLRVGEHGAGSGGGASRAGRSPRVRASLNRGQRGLGRRGDLCRVELQRGGEFAGGICREAALRDADVERVLWACSAHSSKKRAWAKTAQALDLAPPKLFQTNREDHPQAAANKAQFAQGLERHFVGDAECVKDIKSLGGSALLARYESFQQPAHRADLWRYIRLWKEGGSYLDIKMALLQPWSTTLQEIYAEGERCLEGQRLAQSSGQRVAPPTEVRDLSQVPHLLLTIGQNRKHIFQGNIWHA